MTYREAHRGNLLRILIYHRINHPGMDNGLLDPSLISATPEQFDQQMRFLREHYQLLSIRDLLQAHEAKEPLPPKSVMITFDDGYHEFLNTAWPVLERYQVPALMFLATGYLAPENQIFWWDRLYQGIHKTTHLRLLLPPVINFPLETNPQRWNAFNKLKRQISCMDFYSAMQLVDQIMEALEVIPETRGILLNWSEARFLEEQGCCLAAHTRSHPILSRIPREDACREIHDSRQDICREMKSFWPVIAYPSGHSPDCRDDLSSVLDGEGFTFAMTSIPGINIFPRTDPLKLKRIGLSPQLTFTEFQLALTGIYHAYSTVQRVLLHRD